MKFSKRKKAVTPCYLLAFLLLASQLSAQSEDDGSIGSLSTVSSNISVLVQDSLAIKTEVTISGLKVNGSRALNGEFCLYSTIKNIQTTTLGSDNLDSEIFLENENSKLPVSVDIKTIANSKTLEGREGCLPEAPATRVVQVHIPEHLIKDLPVGVYTGTLKVIIEPL